MYGAAEWFVEECLRSDGSLFTPGRPVWAHAPIEDFYTRFVVNEDTGSGNFMEKLEPQLAGAADETMQLAAEAFYFNSQVQRRGQAEAEIALAVGVVRGTKPAGGTSRFGRDLITFPLDRRTRASVIERSGPAGMSLIDTHASHGWSGFRRTGRGR